MPAHYTHMYTARRVADHLLSGEFPDWPAGGDALKRHSPQECGTVMKTWEKFTALGAVGPDLFYFMQDWNNEVLGPVSDEIMLAFAIYYFYDAASEEHWEPLLIILDQVNSQMAALIRFLIKLDKIWKDFVAGWNATIGPIVSSVEQVPDDLLGGILSEFGDVLTELKVALKAVAEEELVTYKDVFTGMNTCVQKGYQEPLFLWSDMSHYRGPSRLSRALVSEAEALHDGTDTGGDKYQQFLAFALGYITHLGTDTVAHAYVNEQCGGPYRDHPARHHLIEQHIDAWVYRQTGEDGPLPTDPWGAKDGYPDMSTSALWFMVQMTPDDPYGKDRPEVTEEDTDARKAALDVDGEMPLWMAESIVKAMIAAFTGHDHPQILQGDAFQAGIDESLLGKWLQQITGHGLDEAFQMLHDDICPTPSFSVPHGFPLPWEIRTVYKIMYSFYRVSYNGTWELQKPLQPPFIILPPASDISNVLQPPDLSGIDSSDPIVDVCEAFIALLDWAVKEIEAGIQLIGDLIKMLASPFTYPIRMALYDLAMMVWDLICRTHEIMVHTGFFTPHGEQRYASGELRLPNEIDLPLITLGGTVDSAFRQALAGAFDPLGNLDTNQDVIGNGHPIPDRNVPFYPVLKYHMSEPVDSDNAIENWEYRRPWAFPDRSPVTRDDGSPDTLKQTPTETYNPQKSFQEGPDEGYKPLRPGPYPAGSLPNVFFNMDGQVDPDVRSAYEQAQHPWDTDQLNEQHISEGLTTSPLGDPIPFSSYLISQIANDTGYATQFNLDSDRAFAYLTWDWVRNDINAPGGKGTELGKDYATPVVAPVQDPVNHWQQGNDPLELDYVDAPPGTILE